MLLGLSCLLLSAALGAAWPRSERVLFVVPTMAVAPLPPLAQLPLVGPRFDGWLNPATGIDTPLIVAQVQAISPGGVRAAAPSLLIPAYPTTPPLPPLITVPDAPNRQPYGGDGCAPRGVPAVGTLNQGFHSYHLGVDIGVQVGTLVKATHSGVVVFAGWSEIGYGYLVILQNRVFTTYYGHNSEVYVQAGEQVGRGSVIAASGSSGNSTGPHIHYEVRINDVPVDPVTFEDAEYVSC
jgi:murein DD-endopeptidase MepM/ murein hydrolase activator NlpD